jgi:hypothetical protein
VVGDLTLTFEALDLAAGSGLRKARQRITTPPGPAAE